MGTRYHFVTEIEIRSPIGTVWEVLSHSELWPAWWRWLREVEILDEGAADGVGRRILNTVDSPLRYRLTYVGTATRVEEPHLLEFESSGELLGVGQFRIEPTDQGGTGVVFNWLVETPKWWMNLLAPVARPLFSWNHDRLMTDFAAGLATTAGGELVRTSNHSVSPKESGFYRLPA